MSNKRKPRKKHRPLKRMQQHLNRCFVYRWESEYDFEIEHEAYHVYVKQDPIRGFFELEPATLKNGIILSQMKWFLCVRVLFKNEESEWAHFRTKDVGEAKIVNLSTVYNELRNDILEKQQYKHIVDVGFIAFSYFKKPLFNEAWREICEGAYTDERQLLFRFADNETNKEVTA